MWETALGSALDSPNSADSSPLIVKAAQVTSSDIDYCTVGNHFKQINPSLETHTLPQGLVLQGKGAWLRPEPTNFLHFVELQIFVSCGAHDIEMQRRDGYLLLCHSALNEC